MSVRKVGSFATALCFVSLAGASTLDSSGAGCTVGNPCNDTVSSLGKFVLQVTNAALQAGLTGNPNYDAGTNLFVSPLLHDAATLIGRSFEFADGSANDTTNGITIGTGPNALTNVIGDPGTIPSGFPTGNNEIHTAMLDMNLTNGAGFTVRGGVSMTEHHVDSLGEVQNTGASDFPANSFFDIFVDIDVLGVGELYNTAPLVVQSQGLTELPPTVLYTHGSSTSVPVYFNADNPGFWLAGDQAGTLLLAGHGANMDLSQTDAFNNAFKQFALSDPGLTPNEISFLDSTLPSTPEPSGLITMLSGAGFLALGWRRRKAR